MFSFYAGNARISRLVVGAVANCSTHAGLGESEKELQLLCERVDSKHIQGGPKQFGTLVLYAL